MSEYKRRITGLFLPLFLASLTYSILYLLVYWYFFSPTNVQNDGIVWDVIFILIVPFSVILFIVKRVKKLEKDGEWWLTFSVAFVTGVFLFYAQSYIDIKTGVLSTLENVDSIDLKHQTLYYQFIKFEIDKKHTSSQSHFYTESAGKGPTRFIYDFYMVAPIRSINSEKSVCDINAWLGVKYKMVLKNRIEEPERNRLKDDFLKKSQADFNTKYDTHYGYFKVSIKGGDHEYFSRARWCMGCYSTSGVILLPETTPFDKRADELFIIALCAWGICNLILFWVVGWGEIGFIKQLQN